MTVFLKRNLVIEASQQQNGRDPILVRGGADKRISGVSTLDEGGLKKIALPIPSVDVDLMMDSVASGRVLYLETDTEITVKLDSASDTGFTVKPLDDTKSGLGNIPGTIYLETAFTHVYVTVAGTSGEANIVIGILGE